GPWMAFAALENTVAGNHRQWTLDRLGDDLFSHREDRDHAAGFPILIERIFRKSLTGRSPLQVFVVDAKTFLPTFVEYRRLDVGHPGDVGITLRRHVEPSRLRFRDHLQQLRSCWSTCALNVH